VMASISSTLKIFILFCLSLNVESKLRLNLKY